MKSLEISVVNESKNVGLSVFGGDNAILTVTLMNTMTELKYCNE